MALTDQSKVLLGMLRELWLQNRIPQAKVGEEKRLLDILNAYYSQLHEMAPKLLGDLSASFQSLDVGTLFDIIEAFGILIEYSTPEQLQKFHPRLHKIDDEQIARLASEAFAGKRFLDFPDFALHRGSAILADQWAKFTDGSEEQKIIYWCVWRYNEYVAYLALERDKSREERLLKHRIRSAPPQDRPRRPNRGNLRLVK